MESGLCLARSPWLLRPGVSGEGAVRPTSPYTSFRTCYIKGFRLLATLWEGGGRSKVQVAGSGSSLRPLGGFRGAELRAPLNGCLFESAACEGPKSREGGEARVPRLGQAARRCLPTAPRLGGSLGRALPRQ